MARSILIDYGLLIIGEERRPLTDDRGKSAKGEKGEKGEIVASRGSTELTEIWSLVELAGQAPPYKLN